MNQDKALRIKELVKRLNEASKAYYQEDCEIMSNYEYDALYDELVALEQETGIILANSPTVKVGYEILSELEKEAHGSPMLSLDKTKSPEALQEWLGQQKGVLSWKLDGLTVVLTYNEGVLAKAVTRGNGEIGEVITNNAQTFVNIPKKIPYLGELIIRGEAVIQYSDFERINATIEREEDKYKNPRNLCSGTVRQLNNEITAKRNVHFFAFNLVEIQDVDFHNSFVEELSWLSNMGFDVVEHKQVNRDNLLSTIQWFSQEITTNDFPSDGLVLIYDDLAYGKSLGRTAKFPRDSIAFKWADELVTTTFREIEWSPSRTGLINPVAIFDSVELEGTTVSRASVHNVSILESLQLGAGDQIRVYKANMIIPQIQDNLTKSNQVQIPSNCPACGGETEIRKIKEGKALYCKNPYCTAKKTKLFEHFVSREAMNIDGISEATIEKFVELEILRELADFYHLSAHKEVIVKLEGYGTRSYNKLIKSIDESRTTTLSRLIYGLGIPNVGKTTAKLICKGFHQDIEALIHATVAELTAIEGIGEVTAQGIVNYFEHEENIKQIRSIIAEIQYSTEDETQTTLEGLSFVITGSVNHFANRNELKELIEQQGGKVLSQVSGSTSYLINNDIESTSSKNKKAKSLGIPIITEEEFLDLIQSNA